MSSVTPRRDGLVDKPRSWFFRYPWSFVSWPTVHFLDNLSALGLGFSVILQYNSCQEGHIYIYIHIYYMTNPALGKSLCSDWFFLGQDFAVRAITIKRSNPVYFSFGAKPANSKFATKTAKKKTNKQTNCEYCHSPQWNYQKKLERLKFFQHFKDGWRRQTFSKQVLLSLRSRNFWWSNWNRHHRVPYNKQLTNQAYSGHTGEYWPQFVAVRTSLRLVSTATSSGQYSSVLLLHSVSKQLVLL